MNETLAIIRRRRSIRQYKQKQLTEAELQAILDAAIHAPSARNQQKWHFTVIQNQAMLERLGKLMKERMIDSGVPFMVKRASEPDFDAFNHAPTAIVISADENARFVQIDCGAAAQNIVLAAESLNIGSCIMTTPDLLFVSEKGNDLKRELGFPDGYNHVCTILLGYTDGKPPSVPQRDSEVISYIR